MVYLVQVPFNADGWGIFRYYPLWGIWTLCTIPMGYIGWYIKKEKWWGVIVLSSMMLFLGFFYRLYLTEMVSYFPKHILTVIFCVATFVTCGLFIFHDRKLRIAQFMINLFIIAVMTLLVFVNGRNVYNTSLLPCSDELSYDDTCEVSLKNKKFGEVSIGYDEGIGTYIINANFTDIGQTELILTTKDGTEHRYKLNIYRNSYEIDEIK